MKNPDEHKNCMYEYGGFQKQQQQQQEEQEQEQNKNNNMYTKLHMHWKKENTIKNCTVCIV